MPTSFIDASAARELITIEEVGRHLRVTDTDHGVEMAATLKAAREWAERYTSRTFRSTVTRTLWLEKWPDQVELQWPPVASVTSVKYYDDSASDITVDSSNYRLVSPTDGKCYICWDDDFQIPGHETRPDAIRVVYVTGGTLPLAARQAILMMAELMWGGDNAPLKHLHGMALEQRSKSLLDTIDAHIYR